MRILFCILFTDDTKSQSKNNKKADIFVLFDCMMWYIFTTEVFFVATRWEGVRDKEMLRCKNCNSDEHITICLWKELPYIWIYKSERGPVFTASFSDSILWLHCSPLMPKSYEMSALRVGIKSLQDKCCCCSVVHCCIGKQPCDMRFYVDMKEKP